MSGGPAGSGTARGPGPSEFPRDRRIEDAAREQRASLAASGPRLQWPLVVVLGGMGVSLVVVATDHFRRGSVLFAAFALLAFFLRLLLSDQDAGWLAIRSRAVDLVTMGILGLALSVFALIVPPPS